MMQERICRAHEQMSRIIDANAIVLDKLDRNLGIVDVWLSRELLLPPQEMRLQFRRVHDVDRLEFDASVEGEEPRNFAVFLKNFLIQMVMRREPLDFVDVGALHLPFLAIFINSIVALSGAQDSKVCQYALLKRFGSVVLKDIVNPILFCKFA